MFRGGVGRGFVAGYAGLIMIICALCVIVVSKIEIAFPIYSLNTYDNKLPIISFITHYLGYLVLNITIILSSSASVVGVMKLWLNDVAGEAWKSTWIQRSP